MSLEGREKTTFKTFNGANNFIYLYLKINNQHKISKQINKVIPKLEQLNNGGKISSKMEFAQIIVEQVICPPFSHSLNKESYYLFYT